MAGDPHAHRPRVGDAASLWNFTPAPGWTKEEAHVLKLLLMKHGVGRWLQILDSGLLPGKLIQQLNGQTQRLLGQQSLAAYTGLQVDVDRIRADNERRTGVERKQGLVVHNGRTLSKEERDELQREALETYGMSTEQLAAVEEQVAELAQGLREAAGEQPLAEAAEPEDDCECDAGVPALIALDTSVLDEEAKVSLLIHMHAKLLMLVEKLGGKPGQQATGTQAYPRVTLRHAPARRPGVQGSSAQGRRARASSVDSDDGFSDPDADWQPVAAGAGRRAGTGDKCGDELQGAVLSPLAEDVAQLTALGYSRQQAREALVECQHDVPAAADWLLSNLVPYVT